MRRFADQLRDAVMSEVQAQYPELVGQRQDAVIVGPFKGLRRARLKVQQAAEQIPLDQVGAEVKGHATRDVQRVLGISNTDLFLGGQVAGWRRRNVDLITRMTSDTLDRVQGLLDDYDGVRVGETAAALQGAFDMSKARAELIARDQTLKLNANITQEAHRAVGIDRYRWSTSNDGSVRDGHAALEGQVFSYDDPPVTNQKTGDRNNPGEDYQCRCCAIPIVAEYEDAPEPVQVHDGGWDEAAHPRDERGQFADVGSLGTSVGADAARSSANRLVNFGISSSVREKPTRGLEHHASKFVGRDPNEVATSREYYLGDTGNTPLTLTVYHGGQVGIADGNHRIAVARAAGATKIKADVQYMGPKGSVKVMRRGQILPL